ncbi:uncharacterized protein B0H18DRAFT_1129301 [Fomitopsis serialis]|uniref:uncharacterized protein n=1 Tax=Fomitopsis serialis TaxID=139415 RepID=UPI0020087DAF|nr:uncharacterized protein B0H18DRAFT_1129301 [Neoantrodia serialis]KAH9910949.1 hypothetical protein B0H18DRAFT_1129301 [Neoantrodia serialis]
MGFRSFFGSGSATDPFQPLSQLDAASQALVPAAPASSKQVAKAAPPVAPAQATAPKPKPPPSAHIRQGNSKDGAKTIIIHLTQSLSESITPISTEDFAVGANIKQSGYRDVFVACVNCPDHDEFEAITAAVTEKLRALIPHDDVGIQVEYQTVLTSMAIRDCRWSYKDARNTLQNRGSDYFWNTLNEAAKVDKHTRNFVEACIPFHNLPNARLEGRNGGGNIVCAIRDAHSGRRAIALTKKPVLLAERDGNGRDVLTRHNVEIVAPLNSKTPCGESHYEDEHNASALCCAEHRIATGGIPDLCPDEHKYCPNCQVSGHGPSDRRCKFWKRNMQKAWYDNAVKGIEKVVDQQKRVDNAIRALRTKAKRVAKAAADAVASGSGETLEARIEEVTGMPVDQS